MAGLREREQLLTYGCGRLAGDLLADGLLDVLVLPLTPVVAGAGRRLFDDPGHLVRLRLTDSTTFETGAVRLFLKPEWLDQRIAMFDEAFADGALAGMWVPPAPEVVGRRSDAAENKRAIGI